MMKQSTPSRQPALPLTCLLCIFTVVSVSFSVAFGYRWGHYKGQVEYLLHSRTCTSHSQPVGTIWDVQHVPNPPPTYHERVFTEISNSSSFSSPEDAIHDKSWQTLLTPGGGFLYVQEPNGEVNGYGVSMFHQLHCLIMVREMLLGQPMSREHETSDWTEDSMHWLHCLDYLVQGVLCAADDTLEKPGFTKDFQGRIVEGIDGMGHVHRCRDSKTLADIVARSEQEPHRAELLGPTTVFKIPGLDPEGKPWIVSES